MANVAVLKMPESPYYATLSQQAKRRKMAESTPKRRRISNQQKKWTAADVEQIINYLLEHRNFEKPTGQSFYNRMLAELNMDANWTMLKGKIRHLRKKYEQANEWRNSMSTGLEDEESQLSIEAKSREMCPYFDSLKVIFQKDKGDDCLAFHSEELQENATNSSVSSFFHGRPEVEVPEVSFVGRLSRERTAVDIINEKQESRLKQRDQLLKNDEERLKLEAATEEWKRCKEERQLEQEERQMDQQERRLQLDVETEEWRRKKEERQLEQEETRLKLEEKKIEKEFELKRLELENTRELLKYELELKYGKK